MFKQLAFGAAAVLSMGLATVAYAAEEGGGHSGGHVEDVRFPFEGPFGVYDQNQLQRGLQIYTEVCSACHGLRYVAFRTLADQDGPGLSEAEVRAYSANYNVTDKETEEDRVAIPSDHFPHVTSMNAPDLSLVAKSRAGFHGPYGTGLSQLFNGIGGPEYIYSLMTGYTGVQQEQAGRLYYENTAFPSGWISMPPPLSGEDVEFVDGSPNDLHNEAMDIAAFLMWTAEPKMMARKQAGFVGVLFLVVLSVLLYWTNKRIWAGIKGKKA
ncbi:cytochrome c1 [Chachezhania sediminis]|uniref:cytochrome c1 n=1 Tax=Chachezhania sediminis TaxID=2599291 RepID=UPI00131DCA19|nr:cytochrome c1 [Chachezhania sediminis]